MTKTAEETTAAHHKCQAQGGCVPRGHRRRCTGRPFDETLRCRCGAVVWRMVMIKQKKGNSVEDYRELRVCANCAVPINPWKDEKPRTPFRRRTNGQQPPPA